MKKIVLTMALAFGTLGFVACSDDDDGGNEKNCAELVQEITTTQQAFANDPSDENCQAYRDALQAYVDKQCEDELDPELMENILQSLPCSE